MPSVRITTLLASALFLVSACLRSQGYDTKFKSVGYKPGEVYHTEEGVNVSLSGGGLEVSLPLGPSLPGPIALRPIFHYHSKFSQSLNDGWRYGAYYAATGDAVNADREYTWKRWSPPSFPSASLHPGKLIIYTGSGGWMADNYKAPALAVTSAQGKRGDYFFGVPGIREYTASDQSEIRGILGAIASEWAYSATWGSASTGSEGFRTSDGSLVVYGPRDHQILGKWDSYTNTDGSPRDVYTSVPTEVIQVDGDLITLWRQSRNVYKADRDERGVATQLWWQGTVYHPVWIKTRSGFKVNVEVSRGTAADFASSPRIPSIPAVERGLLTGWKVSYTANGQEVGYRVDATSATPITFLGLGSTPNTTGLSLSGAVPAQVRNTVGWMAGTTDGYDSLPDQRFYDAEYISDELQVGNGAPLSMTHGPLVTTIEFNGPAQGLISKLITPSGKTYLFDYSIVNGVGVNVPGGGQIGGWNYNAVTYSARDFWSVVTKMEVQDGGPAAQSRITTYQWAIPQPAMVPGQTNGGTWTWQTTNHGVAQTLPDGQTVLHVFASPLNAGTTNLSTLEFSAKDFMAMRQSVIARYTFKAGDTSWQPFFSGGDPSSGSWYQREIHEGWDFRGWEASISKIMTNAEPRSTRQISEIRGGPVGVTERDSWDPANNQYQVSRSYTLAPNTLPPAQLWAPGALAGIGGSLTYLPSPGTGESPIASATSHGVKATTFSPATEFLFGKPATAQFAQLRAPNSGTTGLLPKEVFTYDSASGKAHILTTKRQISADSQSYMDLGFSYAPQGLFQVNRLMEVTLTGTAPNQAAGASSLSGMVGAKYGYDSTGRWMTSIQLRKDGASYFPYMEQEPNHDELGRPLSQVDVNGYASSFAWDLLGRLTNAAPSAPEVGTYVTPDNSLRKVTVDRGAQRTVYHLNGFGDLIAEERVDELGGASHRLFGFDQAGRKAWETVWRPLSPDLTKWTGPLPGPGTLYVYDDRSRLTRTTNPNGEVVETRYDIGGDPLVTQKVIAPGTTKEAITSFKRDALGRLAQVITKADADQPDLVTKYTYDPAGRILQVEQQNPVVSQSQFRAWEYDGLGRLTALVQPESGRTEYGGFTVTGKPTVAVYGAGSAHPKTVTTSYDAQSRPTAVSSSDGSVAQTLSYDESGRGASNGRMTTSLDTGTSLVMTYAGLNGRLSDLLTTSGGQSFGQTFSYDTSGRRTQTMVGTRKVVSVFNDATSWVNGITYTGSDGIQRNVVNLTHDRTSWMPSSLAFGNGASTLLQYRTDQLGLGSLAHYASGGGGPLAQWTYLYDSAGNLKTDGEDTFEHDLLGRLKSATIRRLDGTSVTQSFTYDAFGSRLSSTATGNLPSAVINVAFANNTVELNSRNQLPVQTSSGILTGANYDEQGNLKYIWAKPGDSGTQLGLIYDALGRVIQLSDAKRSGFYEKYFYSSDGLRVRIEEYLNGTLQKTRYNIYNDQRQLISKYSK